MKFSGRISGNSATLTVVGEKNAATVRRIIDNIQNMDLVNELREKGYERIADTNGFVNIRNMQTGETAGFESLREARNMFLDPDNEFFHPTAIRIEENTFFRIVSDEPTEEAVKNVIANSDKLFMDICALGGIQITEAEFAKYSQTEGVTAIDVNIDEQTMHVYGADKPITSFAEIKGVDDIAAY